MHYLSLLAALGLPLSVIAALCDSQDQQVIVGAWYENWAVETIPPTSISFEKLSTVTFAFAVPQQDPSNIVLDAGGTLNEIVEMAHKQGVSVCLSYGGFGGSTYFSSAVSDANRTIFVKAVTALANQYGVDCIEIDWEFPGKKEECNTNSPDDAANFLLFLQELRQSVGNKMLISAAVSIVTWTGPDGTPLTDVSEYAQVLDYISMMNYDLFGEWTPTVGPNAPMNDSCAPPGDQEGSAVSGINNWVNAGFPSKQIVLAMPAYAHSFSVPTTAAFDSTGQLALFPLADRAKQPLGDGDSPSTIGTPDQCGLPIVASGTLAFSSLISRNYLDADGNPAEGINSIFDQCSETPFVYNNNTEIMVAYDNKESFVIKGEFIVENNLKGSNLWYAGADSNDILLDAVRTGMGIKSC